MADTTENDSSQKLLESLLKEYEMCQQKANSLADNIWKTALILGFGSIIGLITLAGNDKIPDDLRPWLTVIISLFSIGILLGWYRLFRRWSSIEQVMFRRMEHIERQIQFKTNLYIGYLNHRVDFTVRHKEELSGPPVLDIELLKDLDNMRKDYEYRGIKPMIRFITELNILAWFTFACFTIVSYIQRPGLSVVITIIFSIIFLVLFYIRY